MGPHSVTCRLAEVTFQSLPQYTISQIKNVIRVGESEPIMTFFTNQMMNIKADFHFYNVSQKTRHQTLSHNFTNYYPIFKIFSLVYSVVNWQQTDVQMFHHALNMSLHYLVTYECQNGIILKNV